MKVYIGKKDLERIDKYMRESEMLDTTLHYMNLLYNAKLDCRLNRIAIVKLSTYMMMHGEEVWSLSSLIIE